MTVCVWGLKSCTLSQCEHKRMVAGSLKKGISGEDMVWRSSFRATQHLSIDQSTSLFAPV